MAVETTLRAVTKGDTKFLQAVYASTREQELALVPWTDAQKAAFCDMQFKAQDTHYRTHFPQTQFLVIERGGVPAGRLYVDRREKEICVMDISLLPAHRNAGTGTRLLRGLMDEAAAGGRSVTIHVEKFNPALRLYQRLGFLPVEDKGVYLQMEWRAS